jgi:hypothetical protein
LQQGTFQTSSFQPSSCRNTNGFNGRGGRVHNFAVTCDEQIERLIGFEKVLRANIVTYCIGCVKMPWKNSDELLIFSELLYVEWCWAVML